MVHQINITCSPLFEARIHSLDIVASPHRCSFMTESSSCGLAG